MPKSPLFKFFLEAGNDEYEIKDVLKKVIDLGISFETSDNVTSEGVNALPSQVVFNHMPNTGLSYEELIQAFSAIASQSSNWSSPNFPGFPDAANNVAAEAVNSGPPLDEAGHVLSIRKTAEYLASDEMLKRLVFNVLTTPKQVFSARGEIANVLRKLEQDATHKLVGLIRRINQGKVNTVDDFIQFAGSDGARSGEAYLGYKPSRDNVAQKLRQIFKDVIEMEK